MSEGVISGAVVTIAIVALFAKRRVRVQVVMVVPGCRWTTGVNVKR